MTFSIDIGYFIVVVGAHRAGGSPVGVSRSCPVCRTKIVVPDGEGTIMVRNAILRVSRATGSTTAKCPRCKEWVEVPLRYQP